MEKLPTNCSGRNKSSDRFRNLVRMKSYVLQLWTARRCVGETGGPWDRSDPFACFRKARLLRPSAAQGRCRWFLGQKGRCDRQWRSHRQRAEKSTHTSGTKVLPGREEAEAPEPSCHSAFTGEVERGETALRGHPSSPLLSAGAPPLSLQGPAAPEQAVGQPR